VKSGISEETRKIKATQRQVQDFVFMQKVLKSIAPKHSGILKVLAKLQLAKGKENASLGDYEYVRFSEWKNLCFTESFIVNKDAEFSSMVKELSDHNMIQIESDANAGLDYVCIPTSKAKVQEILKSLP